MRELAQIIQGEIDGAGAISFARFMELALYHPGAGYYERSCQQTGREGDFYTSVSVGSLYGEILGCDFSRRLRQLEGSELQIVEAGAHDGQLAADLLGYWQQYQAETYARVRYVILEPSAARAEWQRRTLAAQAGKVAWKESWDEIREFRGICFSNELLDAMPVHLFRWNAESRAWAEWGVTGEGGVFAWACLPAEHNNARARALLPRLPEELLEVLPHGFALEASPGAVAWWSQAAERLKSGWLWAADYGLLEEDFVAPHRTDGTLRAYARHQVKKDVLDRPGEQDITAHVNFSLLIKAGESAGLRQEEFGPQGAYLTRVLERIAATPAEFPPWTPARRRQLMSLMHPEHLGRAFQVLTQARRRG